MLHGSYKNISRRTWLKIVTCQVLSWVMRINISAASAYCRWLSSVHASSNTSYEKVNVSLVSQFGLTRLSAWAKPKGLPGFKPSWITWIAASGLLLIRRILAYIMSNRNFNRKWEKPCWESIMRHWETDYKVYRRDLDTRQWSWIR